MKPEHLCLLVVDDEDDFRTLVKHRFRRRGYRVLEASHGEEALEVYDQAERVDLVITDIRMPKMSGDVLIQRLRAIRPFLPIIGVTGHADLKGKLAALDGGAYYSVDKPLPDLAFLERLVENAIRLHHHERSVHEQRERELSIAKLIRGHMLEMPISHLDPEEAAQRRFEIALEPIELDRPGGDYAEWFLRGDNQLLFYVADAMGHDLSATFVAFLSTLVLHRSHHRHDAHEGRPDLDTIVTNIDRALDRLRKAGALDGSQYLTFFIGCLDLETGVLRYVNAAHPEAFVVPAKGKVRRLGHTCGLVGHLSLIGRPVGVGEERLEPGDLLFVYSDGASEMLEEPGEGKALSIGRLAERVASFRLEPAAAAVSGIKAFLVDKAGDDGFDDDVTLLALRWRHGGAPAAS